MLKRSEPLEPFVNTSTSRDGAVTGSGLNSRASTMANSAVLKPMPIASDAMATSAKPGLLRSQRSAKRTSASSDSIKADDYKVQAHRSRPSLAELDRCEPLPAMTIRLSVRVAGQARYLVVSGFSRTVDYGQSDRPFSRIKRSG